MDIPAPKGAGFFMNIKNRYMLGTSIQHISPPKRISISMTMSRTDIIAHAKNIQANDLAVLSAYYFTPINDDVTQLRNMNDQIYHIPTNKLSDIHAILRILHPDKDYFIKYEHPTKRNDIFVIRGRSQHPDILQVEPPRTNNTGYYALNTNHITPIICNHISIQQAIEIARAQIETQCAFMRLHPDTAYEQDQCSGKIYPFNDQYVYMRYRIYNIRYCPNIMIDINVQRQDQTYFFAIPNNTQDIDTSITHACNNILANIQHHPDIYCDLHSSQHQYIALLRAAEHYFAQPDHSLRTSIHQALENFQEHYTYQK